MTVNVQVSARPLMLQELEELCAQARSVGMPGEAEVHGLSAVPSEPLTVTWEMGGDAQEEASRANDDSARWRPEEP